MTDLAGRPIEQLMDHEWIVTNGIGGYSSSTIACLNTRKYHGLLVAAMAPPVRRMVLLSRLEETVHIDGRSYLLACNEYPDTFHPHGHQHLIAFDSEPHPRWAYQGDGWTIEKELCLLRGQNTALISYTLLGASRAVELELMPLLALRGMHELSYQWNGALSVERSRTCRRVPPTRHSPEVFFAHDGDFVAQPQWNLNTIYRREQQRGYAGLEDLWMPGVIRCTLEPGRTVHFACSSDPIELSQVIAQTERADDKSPAPADDAAALRRSAASFVIDVSRDSESRVSVIGSFPWGGPSSRAALMGFAGLFLVSDTFAQGRALLLSLAAQLNNGLIPSDWPEDGSAPAYRAADVSLWFVHAVDQYLRYTGDEQTVGGKLLDAIDSIIASHRRGTDLGIGIDADGLLSSHKPGQATTWMDAKVGDWVITPRAGKPVELNALWYNALCVADELHLRFRRDNPAHNALAAQVRSAFNARFWNESANCCYDVLDPLDASIRPNQILAMSLPHAALDSSRHAALLETVCGRLLTPFGLRTLDVSDPSFQGRCDGNVVSRDRAVHQGSVHPWLLGALASAHVRMNGRSAASREQGASWIKPCLAHLQQSGCLPELFDGDAPHHPRGAISSALACAELLRCQVEDISDRRPNPVRRVADIVFTPRKAPAKVG